MKTTLEVVEVVNGECRTLFFMDVIDEEPWLVPLLPATEETPLFRQFKEGAGHHQGFIRCSHQVSDDGLVEHYVLSGPGKNPCDLYLDYFPGQMSFTIDGRHYIVGAATGLQADEITGPCAPTSTRPPCSG